MTILNAKIQWLFTGGDRLMGIEQQMVFSK